MTSAWNRQADRACCQAIPGGCHCAGHPWQDRHGCLLVGQCDPQDCHPDPFAAVVGACARWLAERVAGPFSQQAGGLKGSISTSYEPYFCARHEKQESTGATGGKILGPRYRSAMAAYG